MLQTSYSDNYYNKAAKNIHENDPSKQPIIGAVVQLYYLIVGAGAVPVRLFLRENFGERSISPIVYAVSLFFHCWYVFYYVATDFQFFGLLPSGVISEIDKSSYFFFSILIVFNAFTFYLVEVFYIKAKKHFSQVITDAQKGKKNKKSYYRGDGKYFRSELGKYLKTPLGTFTIDETFMRMLIEPWWMLRFGFFIFFNSLIPMIFISLVPLSLFRVVAILLTSVLLTGIVIILSSICLFLEELGIFLKIRNSALDLIDGGDDLALILKERDKILSNSNNKISQSKQDTDYPVVKIY